VKPDLFCRGIPKLIRHASPSAGVSQRYLSEDAADLASEKEEILRKVKDFFCDVVKERFDGLSTCECT